MSRHYRCSKASCRKRVAIKGMRLAPKCPSCGNDTLRRDRSHEKEGKANKCNCDASHYPHKKGSLVFCKFYQGVITDQDYENFYNMR